MRFLKYILLAALVLSAQGQEDLFLLTANEAAGRQLSHDLYRSDCAGKGQAWNTNTHRTIYMVPVVRGTNALNVTSHWLRFDASKGTNLLHATNAVNLKTKAAVELTGVTLLAGTNSPAKSKVQ